MFLFLMLSEIIHKLSLQHKIPAQTNMEESLLMFPLVSPRFNLVDVSVISHKMIIKTILVKIIIMFKILLFAHVMMLQNTLFSIKSTQLI